jgi:four helix bundle protein
MVCAWPFAMGAKKFEDLEAWRIADELKREVYALIATGAASKDFKFCNQIRESAASPTGSIAEGFGRFRPGPFAQFMEMAIGSAMETRNSLKDGIDRGYVTVESIHRASELAQRCIQVSTKLLRYLERCHKRGT